MKTVSQRKGTSKGKSGSVVLRHATPRKNLKSILSRGILCSKSQGAKPVVWLHKAERSAWAMVHTVLRHGGRIENVVILEVCVPRAWLRKSGEKGLVYSTCDIRPERIRNKVGFVDVAKSPIVDSEPPALRLVG
jgi:hypothetical protein